MRLAPLRRHHIPQGCDQQGRYPQAAEACTEYGMEDEQELARPYRRAIDLLIICAVVTALYVLFWGLT